jgi:hypothetical protein
MRGTHAGATAAVLAGLIDDAALFPPGNAALPAALREHALRARGPFAYAAGPFIVPARRLTDLVEAQRADAAAEMPQRLSVLVDYDRLDETLEEMRRILSACDSPPAIEAVELRIPSVGDAVAGLLRAFRLLAPVASTVFVESSQMGAPGEARRLTDAIMALGRKNGFAVGAKVRTGGVEQSAVPSSARVAEFIAAQRRELPWKATAGLHHPVRGEYGTQTMHGFLNILAATAAAYRGDVRGAELVELLASNPSEIGLTPDAFVWGELRFETQVIADVRRDRFRSFGSCSFDEPLDGLRELGLL